MTNILILSGLFLLVVIVVQQIIQLRRKVTLDLSPVETALQSVRQSYEQVERSVREEVARNREEGSNLARQSREELASTLKGVADTLSDRIARLTASVEEKLQGLQAADEKRATQSREEAATNASLLREEVVHTLTALGDVITANIKQLSAVQKDQLDLFSGSLNALTESVEQKLTLVRQSVDEQMKAVQAGIRKELTDARQQSGADFKALREEIAASLNALRESTTRTMTEIAGLQKQQLDSFSIQLGKLTEGNERQLEAVRTSVDERLRLIQEDSSKKLDQVRLDNAAAGKQMREEVTLALSSFNHSVLNTMTGISEGQKAQMLTFTEQLGKLIESNEQRLEILKMAVEARLKSIQDDNAKQLEQMRATVDEKLQGTLEKRLGESFKQVSERLEAVAKGLGEMQTLATGVGDLKRVLTNVKTRGTWGEVQLGAMLAEVLTPDQYAANVPTKQGGERVEFAIKLPGYGQDDHEVVWLPIDAKFPIEDYQRLVDAQERCDIEASEAAGKALDVRIKQCAGTICSKYLNPPMTTDFAILFLPTEGLFAEVIRRDGLAQFIQRESRVVIAGPTTLWSILNSLQMGFRTLSIQKRSSEVWNLLAAVKTEWSKYGEVLDKVQKKLLEASHTVDEATRRTRAIGRKLRGVEELPAGEADSVLALNGHNGATVTIIDEEDHE